MNTISIKFNSIGYSKLIVLSLLILLFAMISVYSYLINASVLSVVERKNIEKTISSIGSNVSVLETEYFTKVDGINMELAMSMGFSEKKNNSFAVRKTMAKKLFTLNN